MKRMIIGLVVGGMLGFLAYTVVGSTQEMPDPQSNQTAGEVSTGESALQSTKVLEPWIVEGAQLAPEVTARYGDGWIAGRVIEWRGQLVVGATVSAVPNMPDEFGHIGNRPQDSVADVITEARWKRQQTRTAVTDAQGHFRLEGLVEDWLYDVEVSAEGYADPRRSRRQDVACGNTLTFMVSPLLRLVVTVLMPDGTPTTDCRITYGDSEMGTDFTPDSTPYEIATPYMEGCPVWAYTYSTYSVSDSIRFLNRGWKSERVEITDTGERPIPVQEITLHIAGEPGVYVTLDWPDAPLSSWDMNCRAIPLTGDDPPTVAGLRQYLSENPNYRRKDMAPPGPNLQGMPPRAQLRPVSPGRVAIVAYTESSLVILAHTVIDVPEGADRIFTHLTIPAPVDDDYLTVRFDPPGIGADVDQNRVYMAYLRGTGPIQRMTECWLNPVSSGLWRLWIGRMQLDPSITDIQLTFRLQFFGYGIQVITIPVADLDRTIDVPLSPPMSFTVRLTNLPEGLLPRQVNLQLNRGDVQITSSRVGPAWAWTVDRYPAGEYTLYLLIDDLTIAAWPIDTSAGNREYELPLPDDLHSLTLTFPPSTSRHVYIDRIDLSANWGRAGLYNLNNEATIQFLAPGRYRIMAEIDGEPRTMTCDIHQETTLTFSPNE